MGRLTEFKGLMAPVFTPFKEELVEIPEKSLKAFQFQLFLIVEA